MKKLIRFLAVIALVLYPVWGVQSIDAASSPAPAHYPTWPSFLSTGCNAIQGPGGSTSISCGSGSFLLSQINSGYECNNVDISVSSLQSGSFLAVGTADSGSVTNSVTIDGPGNYFMQFPGFLTNNLVTIQFTAAGSGAVATIDGITSSPCAVPTSTDTPNPSFTPTSTTVPVTGTPTPIPTHTPLPSGRSTFTPTVSPTGTVASATKTPTITVTPDVTNTPVPGYNPMIDCGLVLDCNFGGGPAQQGPWEDASAYTGGGFSGVFGCIDGVGFDGTGVAASLGWTPTWQDVNVVACRLNVGGVTAGMTQQVITAPTAGELCWTAGISSGSSVRISVTDMSGGAIGTIASQSAFQADGCFLGTISAGEQMQWRIAGGASNWMANGNWYMGSGGGTPVPTNTLTVTNTPTPSPTGPPGTPTDTPIPSDTPIPIPGAMSTAIATSTECPDGCAVTALTAIPGLATITTVDTSPFSQLQHLSLSRNGCTAFGYVQIPYPVIHGTPILGSANPISVTWTLPVTHDWDNTNPYSNTAIEPCAMNEIPTFVWDFTYWLSVFGASVVWIMWMIGLVGRLSGDETING